MKKFKKSATGLLLAGILVGIPAVVQAGTVEINYRLPAYGYRATDSTTKDDFDPAVVNLTYFGRAGGVDATGMGEFPGYMYQPITWTANIHSADRYNLHYQSSDLANIAYADLCYLKIKTDAVTEYELDVRGKFAP
ncbi:hypothetical protein JCM1393_19580 [Clostridium carnis]